MKQFIFSNKIQLAVIIAALTIGFATAGYFFYQYQNIKQQLQNPADFTKEQIQATINRVGKLIELPTDEIPTVATISDTDKLKDQPFFANAKNGDKLLVYNNARRAILYDPIANKIIDVAPINIGSPSATATNSALTASPTPQPVRVFLLNGTTTAGLTKKYEETLKKTLPNVVIVDRDNAQKTDYANSILIDINGSKAKEISQISKTLGIIVGKLPEGETKPGNADFLIILGKDKEGD